VIRLLNVGELGSILNKAEKTIYNYLESGMFDCAFKIGNEWRMKENDLWDWIERQKSNYGMASKKR